MSKLDNIILDCANKVLDGNEETLGDYIDPTKEAIKALMLELVGEQLTRTVRPNTFEDGFLAGENHQIHQLRKKIGEL